MSVSNYTPDKCRYYIGKLEDIVYLVSENALKDIKIDNGNAFVASVSESPLSIKCYNLKLTEEESLDERYKFTHTVTFSVNGYMNKDNFNDKYYVILKDAEGTYWLVNPLFPSKVTYNYKLGYNENHTDFTLATASNHPVLRLNEFNVDDAHECEAYWYDGIAELKLNEKKYSAHIDNHIKYTNASGFKDVDFNDGTCVVTESFDGSIVSHQIDFNIMLSQYKNDWHYTLLEFMDNTYAAVFKTLNEKYGLCGFSMGLQPSFTIDADSESMSNTIKITLKDAHTDGLTLDFYDSVDYEYLSAKTWVYTADYGGYECIGEGTARYLLKKEVDAFDNETGNYMVLDGYESHFQESLWPVFHIADTFDSTEIFSNMECMGSDCTLNASFPSQIEFYEEGCQNFYVEADTNWAITPSKDYITVSPSSGLAHTAYDVVVCNTMQPTDTADTSTLTIEYCSTSSTVNITVVEDPSACLPQGAVYNVPANGQTLTIPTRCCVESVNETAGFGTSSTVFSNYIQTVIPENTTGNNRQAVLLVIYCDGNSGNIIINQSNIYEEWRIDGELCVNRNKIQREFLWTGTTSSNYVKTDEYNDTVIEYDSYDCYSTDEWNYRKYVVVEGEWFCDDGNKYALERMYVSMDRINWRPTEIYRKGEPIEEHSTDCCWDDKWFNYPYSKYIVVDGEWICNDGNKYQKLLKYFSMDNVTWESSICIFKMGNLIEENSDDCGYINGNKKYRWVLTDGYVCIEPEIGWVNLEPSVDYYCSGTTKYFKQKKIISIDFGETWNFASPAEYRRGESADTKSVDCGYIPVGEHTKFHAEYPGDIEYTINCDNNTSLTSGETKPSGYMYSAMTDAIIGNCVTNIGSSSLKNCNSLTACTIGSGITSIGDSAFRNCYGLTSIDIPNGVTSIGKYAFYGCTNITEITIPSGVTNISERAFMNCSGLTSITVEATNPPTLGSRVFSGISSSCKIYVSTCELVEIYKSAEGWSVYSSIITSINCPSITTKYNITDTVNPTKIASATTGFNSVDIDGVEQVNVINAYTFSTTGEHTVKYYLKTLEIGYRSFYNCASITSCTIGSGTTSIGEQAFRNCSGLTNITIPESLTNIGTYAFYECTNITGITIPSGVTNISDSAFKYCGSLTSVTVEATTPPTLGSQVFHYTNDCPIYVPSTSVTTYKSASGWSGYASRITAII